MDNSAMEEPGVWYRVRHVRAIIIAVTVSFVIVPQFLNGMSFNGVTHDITDVWHTNGDGPHLRSWDEVRRTTQISYIVVAMLSSFHISADYVVHYEINGPWKDRTSLIEYWLLCIFGGLSFFLTFFIVKFLSETKRRPPGFMYIETEDRVLYSALQDDME
ncbi:Protein of unknown function [Gryllus bimaculatus]|nr:Protein of unknown function [Gryllus bimaculatus]